MQITINDNIILRLGQTYDELKDVINNKDNKYQELFNSHGVIIGVILDKIVELTFHNKMLTYIKINGSQDFNKIGYNDIVADIEDIKSDAEKILADDTMITSMDTNRKKLVLSNSNGCSATLMAFDKSIMLIKTLNNTRDKY